jgi:hypothetical protein
LLDRANYVPCMLDPPWLVEETVGCPQSRSSVVVAAEDSDILGYDAMLVGL